MSERQPIVPGIFFACIAAGPLFTLFTLIGGLIVGTGEPISATLEETADMLPLAFLIGGLFAIVPVSFGAVIMRNIADQHPPARKFSAWAIAGAVPGAVLALPVIGQFDTPHFGSAAPVAALGFVATASVCTLICRATLRWD